MKLTGQVIELPSGRSVGVARYKDHPQEDCVYLRLGTPALDEEIDFATQRFSTQLREKTVFTHGLISREGAVALWQLLEELLFSGASEPKLEQQPREEVVPK